MKKLTLLITLCITIESIGQPFSMIKEINTTATDFSISNTATVKQVGSTVFFVANDGVHGNELWKTDGTEAGTQLVKDINPGAGSATYTNFTAGDGLLFFVANDGTTGFELWRSDGTAAGTFMLRDGFSECTLCLNRLFFHNGYLYFAGDDGATGAELWRTDGTIAGTVLIKDIIPGTASSGPAPVSNPQYTFVALGNDVYFNAIDPLYGRELFKTDGTAAGTVLVKDIVPGSSSSINSVNHKAAVFNGKVYFVANDQINGVELWATDGTEAGTYLVADIAPGSGFSNPNNLIVFNSALYFTASSTGGNPNLYKTDGTAAGTVLVRDFVADGLVLNAGNTSAINDFTVAANKLFFRNNSGPLGSELYASDGTTAGTGLVKDILPGANSGFPAGFIQFNNKLYFSATDWTLPSRAAILFESDGTEAGTKRVLGNEIGEVPGSVGNAKIVSGNRMYFTGNTTDAGLELWSTDGMTSGTVLVKDINSTKAGTPNSANDQLGSVVKDGIYYFAAADNQNGRELWKSDGTSAGTVMVKDIWPGKASSNPGGFFIYGNDIYFSASDGVYGTEIWKTDGTESGTVMVADVFPGELSGISSRFNLINNIIYFIAYHPSFGLELWRTDGTASGTSLATELIPGPAHGLSGLSKLFSLNNNGYGIGSVQPGNVLGITQGNRLLKIDGTTNSISDFAPDMAVVNDIALIGTTLYLAGRKASTNQMVLMKSENGAPVTQVKVLNNTTSNVFQLTEAGGKLYFSTLTSSEGFEPWVSDGTEAGTFLLKDIFPGNTNNSTSTIPHQFIFSAGKVFFTAATSSSGSVVDYELWATDGTTAGTYRVKDILPGTAGSRPGGTVAVHGNKILFSANDGASGIELWESDGTADGTRMLQEFNTAGDGFNTGSIFTIFPMIPVVQPVGEKLVFFARSADKGFQLYAGSLSAKYYVNDNSQTGDVFTTAVGSNTNYGTASAPFATLDYAVSQAKNGDTIYVDAGDYSLGSETLISKSITLLGTNYNISPNSSSNKPDYNTARNAESRITGARLALSANDIIIKGFRFSPSISAIGTVNTTNLKNIVIEKNYFDIIIGGTTVVLGGTAFNPTTAINHTVSDNRFNRIDNSVQPMLDINGLKDVVIDNNVFIETGATTNRGTAIRTSGGRIVENINITNNYIKRANNAILTFILKNAMIQNNVFDSCSQGFNMTPNTHPGPLGSSNITITQNTFKDLRSGRSVLLRNGEYGVSNFIISNNTINQSVNGINGTVSVIQLEYINTSATQVINNSTFGITQVLNNVINISGDYTTSTAGSNAAIQLTGNHSNTTISGNELNFSAINARAPGIPGILPPVPTGIYLRTDGGSGYGTIPASATISITNNKINGFKSSIGIYDPTAAGTTSNIGYGFLTNGANVTINNNSLTNDSMSIDNGTVSQLINATCNWYGSNNQETIQSKLSLSTIQHIPWLSNGSDNDAAVGFQPVPNTCNSYPRKLYVNDNNTLGDVFTTAVGNNSNPGTAAAPFVTLQYAITIAKNGDTIYVDAGTYIENIVVNKSVVMLGAKYGQNPGSSLDRGNESIILPAVQQPAGSIIQPTVNHVTIDGFLLDGDNPAISGGTLVNGVDVNTGYGIFNNDVVVESLTAKNNIVKNTSAYGIGLFRTFGNQTGPAVSGNLFSQNRVDNIGGRGIVFAYNAFGNITNNYISRCRTSGTWFSQHRVANVNNAPSYISGNIIVNCNLGMQSSSVFAPASKIYYLNNELSNNTASNFAGISILGVSNTTGFVVANNNISGYARGVYINASNSLVPVSVNNNSITNCTNFAIEVISSNPVTASCNWYGSAAVQNFYTKLSLNADLEILPWLTNGTDNDAATGFQPVLGSCDGYPTLITLNGSTNVTCNGAANGAIDITTSYGKAPFTYTWTKEGDPNFISHDEDPTGLAPGTYTLSLVDGNGSNIYITDPEADGPGTIVVTITEPEVLSASATGSPVSCFEGTNGTASVSAGGGTSPYSYLWSNGATTSSISNLAAGVYNVTVTDDNGCTKQASYEVTQPALLTVSITNNSTGCFNAASANVGGGTAPYSYLWSNGAQTSSISNVAAGTYSVTVTDINGCVASVNITLSVGEAFNPSASVTHVTCFGASTGIITVTNANGIAPFTYSIDGINFVPGALPYSFTGLAAGTYTIAVRDVNGCTGFVTKTVTQPAQLNAALGVIQSTCFGGSTGTISIIVSGGTPSYSYQWSGPNGYSSTQNNINGLAAGNYSVTVTDANGCTANLNAVVPSYNEIMVNANVGNVVCRGETNGFIDLTVSGGTGSGFSYLWNNGATTQDRINLVSGTYNVTITDIGSGCSVTRSYTITQPASLLKLNNPVVTEVLGCTPALLGTISTGATGGVRPCLFKLNNGSYQVDSVFTGLAAGTYTVYVKDAYGCEKSATVTIVDNGFDSYDGSGNNKNNSKGNAAQISEGTISGRIATLNDPRDWYKFTATSTTNYTLSISHASASFVVTMYGAGNNPLQTSGINTSTVKQYALTAGVEYYILVTGGLSFDCYSMSVINPVLFTRTSSEFTVKEKKVQADKLNTSVFPNPHHCDFGIKIESTQDGIAEVEIFNAAGQLVTVKRQPVNKGGVSIVSFINMKQNILFYRVRIGKDISTGKVIGPN